MGLDYKKAKENLWEIEEGIKEFYQDGEPEAEEAMRLTRDLGGLLDKFLGFKEETIKVTEFSGLRAIIKQDSFGNRKLAFTDAVTEKMRNNNTLELLSDLPEEVKTPVTPPLNKVDDYFDFMSSTTAKEEKKVDNSLRADKNRNDKVRASLYNDNYLNTLKSKRGEDESVIMALNNLFSKVAPSSEVAKPVMAEPIEEPSLVRVVPDVPKIVELPRANIVSDEEALYQALTVHTSIAEVPKNVNPDNFFAELDKSIEKEITGQHALNLTEELEILGKAA